MLKGTGGTCYSLASSGVSYHKTYAPLRGNSQVFVTEFPAGNISGVVLCSTSKTENETGRAGQSNGSYQHANAEPTERIRSMRSLRRPSLCSSQTCNGRIAFLRSSLKGVLSLS